MAGKESGKLNLLDLCQKAAAMNQRKLDDSSEDRITLEDRINCKQVKGSCQTLKL